MRLTKSYKKEITTKLKEYTFKKRIANLKKENNEIALDIVVWMNKGVNLDNNKKIIKKYGDTRTALDINVDGIPCDQLPTDTYWIGYNFHERKYSTYKHTFKLVKEQYLPTEFKYGHLQLKQYPTFPVKLLAKITSYIKKKNDLIRDTHKLMFETSKVLDTINSSGALQDYSNLLHSFLPQKPKPKPLVKRPEDFHTLVLCSKRDNCKGDE